MKWLLRTPIARRSDRPHLPRMRTLLRSLVIALALLALEAVVHPWLDDALYATRLAALPIPLRLPVPVAGVRPAALRDTWGGARSEGRRHEGIDIFAPRGTPAIAATDGVVRSTTPSRLGGNLVWLRDDHARQSLYYAHLDTVLVVPGQRVRAGDTLGLVGNTGNARTTPPHLHFGIYARGPVDPYPFVYVPRARPAEVTAALGALGQPRRTAARVTLRGALGSDAGTRLEPGTPLRVLAAAGASYFVRLPDGRAGWLGARATEPLDAPLRHRQLAAGTLLRDAPDSLAVVMDSLATPRDAAVVGRFGGFALVREGARTGWARLGDVE
jgi:hypothetical protein